MSDNAMRCCADSTVTHGLVCSQRLEDEELARDCHDVDLLLQLVRNLYAT